MDEVLCSPRLRLEPLCAAHADEMFIVLGDAAIYEHENAPPTSVEWLRERYRKLESRRSPDGTEAWLNWVLRLGSGQAIGYVQATVCPDQRADIAYELGSRWWGQGLASEAVRTMMAMLASDHGVQRFQAVLKRSNQRSMALLRRLGFELATPAQQRAAEIEPDEWLMTLASAAPLPHAPLGP